MKKKLEQVTQKHKGLQKAIMSNNMAKWTIWKKWTDSSIFQSSKIKPGRNRNYEQPNFKH